MQQTLSFNKKQHYVYFLDSLSRELETKELPTLNYISEFLWSESKDVKVIESFGHRLPQQENGSDCGLFMLEFMLRAFHDLNRLTDFLDNEQKRSEALFGSSLILKRREQYL